MGGTFHQLGTMQTTRIWSNKLIGYTESKRIKLWNSNRLLSLHLNIIFIYHKGWGNLFVDFVVAGEHAVKLEENGNVSFQRSAWNGPQKCLFQMIGVVNKGCYPKMLKHSENNECDIEETCWNKLWSVYKSNINESLSVARTYLNLEKKLSSQKHTWYRRRLNIVSVESEAKMSIL